jgi:hypothetical protein
VAKEKIYKVDLTETEVKYYLHIVQKEIQKIGQVLKTALIKEWEEQFQNTEIKLLRILGLDIEKNKIKP